MSNTDPSPTTTPPKDTAGKTTAELVRHGGGFLVSGLMAFAVDALVLWLLTRWAGFDPFTARLFAIAIAMVVAWLAHRRLTFQVAQPPSLNEFLHFAALAWTAAALNYAVYAMILIVRPALSPLIALVGATAVAMSFSYLGMRFSVFRDRK